MEKATVILRHRKENLKKCSLRGLENTEGFYFYTYPIDPLPVLSNTIVLALEAPPLSIEDGDKNLLILDGTWRYAQKMFHFVMSSQNLICRSIPSSWRTAYPRRQEDCPSPDRGLASIEAIFVAHTILGRESEGLLDNYYWGNDFLIKNQQLFPLH